VNAQPALTGAQGTGDRATDAQARGVRDRDAPSEGIVRLAELMRAARSVVALTGAGISVPSGIPDFRSARTGLWEHVNPMEVAHIDAFRRDPVRFWSFYGERFASLEGKQPNGAHEVLASLELDGLLDGLITQNIDMLHRRAGSQDPVEVHGSIASCSCLACSGAVPLREVRARLAAAPEGVPRCEACNEPLKPDVVLFGEYLDPTTLARAEALCEGADLLLCIGSSLEVHPVAGLPMLTASRGGSVAILTQGPTPLDRLAAVRLDGDVVSELQALSAALAQPGSVATVTRYSAGARKLPSVASLKEE
jgi:NAD-dependent deacetylase